MRKWIATWRTFPMPTLQRLFAPALLGCAFLLGALSAAAFPPAPHYTIYGMVRDQVGTALQVVGAEIVLLRDSTEIGRAPITANPATGTNYQLHIPIDQSRPSSRTYSHRAVASQGLYSVVVEMNGQRFYPIEVSGNLRAGDGGEHIRLDFNLGADTDGDGLPDVWEEWQLFQAGRVQGTPGWSLALITRDGDFDGDGTSNYLEYVAGTFAGDATERFELKLNGKVGNVVSFEFFGITGKVYGIEESADLQTWTAAKFATSLGGSSTSLYTATAIGVQPAYVTVSGGTSRFFRLTVR